ncbi:DUF2254 domain-containing protein [Amnibacterium endophyticum]|uniref:DUF2254 domain-containing protein n=1 Tax=Amnibacterium endophyticum TaxID=2109337 RepID=A0ABW4LF02_9MICO
MVSASSRARGSRTRARLASAREALQARLWPVPALAVVVAVALGVALSQLDLAIGTHFPSRMRTFVFDGDADTARAVLGSIIGALITATSLTFSLTVVAFQLASSQASPRLLRTFARDGFVHGTLAVFLGTFAYALTVLRAVRTDNLASIDSTFVPRIAISFAFVLALVSVITLVLFLAHLAAQLRVETMLKEVHEDTVEAIEVVEGEIRDEESSQQRLDLPAWAPVVQATRSGFISSVDRGRLLRTAARHDLRVEELHDVGGHVIEGLPLLRVQPEPSEDAASDLVKAYSVRYERTSAQDYLFGVQQMVDIAAKALSPGVNDPTTAVHALGHIASILVRLRDMPPTPPSLVDAEGVPRLAPRRADYASAVSASLTQIRRYGAGDLDTVVRLHHLLQEVATEARPAEVRAAITDELRLLTASVEAEDYADVERDRFRAMAQEVRRRLAASGGA